MTIQRANMTPMLQQYVEIKSKYPDAILFYRMGDFYEMFFTDATTAAPVLEVQLTARDKNSDEPIPMCGVPYHSVTIYLQKLLAAGYKVAICEQMEEASATKGLVRRDVTRVITPALIGDPDLVPEQARNYLVCLREVESRGIAVGVLDLLGSSLRIGTLPSPAALAELFRELAPKEVLLPAALAEAEWLQEILRLYPTALVTRRETEGEGEKAIFQALQNYLRETQKLEKLPLLSEATPLFTAGGMTLDTTALESLEIVRSQASQGKTLSESLDRTVTPMGRRALRDWLTRPSRDRKEIDARLSAVENLILDPALAEKLRAPLSQIRDLERLNTKTSLGLAMPRDLVAIRDVLGWLPELRETLLAAKAPKLRAIGKSLQLLPELTSLLRDALEDIAPATLRDGGIFRETHHPEIAEYRGLSRDAKSTIAAMETREKTRTGINSLKIKYSRVFGYTIEVTKTHLVKVPEDYIRKQTIANGERYVTKELKTFEEKVITADHRLRTLEERLFLELRQKVAAQGESLLRNARLLAELDVLLCFARVARERGFKRPRFNNDGTLEIIDGRHPVIETLVPVGSFVPNSVRFAEGECRTLIITGPNMAGKSTIMRQVALIAILAQAGSFVPAASASLPVLDAVFTRIGSSDDLTRGRSTFMVEMTEVARILEQATPSSLILIDEIGRGTSTYDGLSLAWSLLEHIHTSVRAKTLFATHFHEVTRLAKLYPDLRNANVLVDSHDEHIVFLHKLGEGVCSRSYGIEVAKLAGLPPGVLGRAKEILGHLEAQSQKISRSRAQLFDRSDAQLDFFGDPRSSETPTRLET